MTPLRFSPPRPRRTPRENIVPMINVVFLLLIFFLMTAQIAPPVPFDVTPPEAGIRDPARTPGVLHVSGDGALYFDGVEGQAALARAAAEPALSLRADRDLPVARLTEILADLTARGVSGVALVTEPAP